MLGQGRPSYTRDSLHVFLCFCRREREVYCVAAHSFSNSLLCIQVVSAQDSSVALQCSVGPDRESRTRTQKERFAAQHSQSQVAVINKLHAALDLSLCYCRCTLQCILVDTKRICTCSMRPSSRQLFSSVIKMRRLNRFPILSDC